MRSTSQMIIIFEYGILVLCSMFSPFVLKLLFPFYTLYILISYSHLRHASDVAKISIERWRDLWNGRENVELQSKDAVHLVLHLIKY